MPAPNIPGAIVAPTRQKERSSLEQLALSLAAQAPQLAYMLFRGNNLPQGGPTYEQKMQEQYAWRQNMQNPNSPTRQALIAGGLGDATVDSRNIAAAISDRRIEAPLEYAQLEQQRLQKIRDDARKAALRAAAKTPQMTDGGKGQDITQQVLQTAYSLQDAGWDSSMINQVMSNAFANAPSARNLLQYSVDKAALDSFQDNAQADAYATQRYGEIVGDQGMASGRFTITGAGQALMRLYDSAYSATQQKGVDLYQEMVDLISRRIGTRTGGMDFFEAMMAAPNDQMMQIRLMQGNEITVDDAIAEGIQFLQGLDPTGDYTSLAQRLSAGPSRRMIEREADIHLLESQLRGGGFSTPEAAEKWLRAYMTGMPSKRNHFSDGTVMTQGDINYIISTVLDRFKQNNIPLNIGGI